jgi:polygalacturonase
MSACEELTTADTRRADARGETSSRVGTAVRLVETVVTSRSATFEVCNGYAWRSPWKHYWSIDDRLSGASARNVFTVSGLESDTRYRLRLDSGDSRTELEFKTAPERVRVDIREFGAVGDGITDDTAAISAALSACCADGVVEFPAGEWLTSPLFLRSGVSLYLACGARLIGHPDMSRWPVLPGRIAGCDKDAGYFLGSWEGHPGDCHAALLNGIDIHDVRIWGEGCIDANASVATWWCRSRGRSRALRPRTIYLVRAARVAIAGIILRNSPSWTVHALWSHTLGCSDLRIESPSHSPDTNGIVPESCQQVRITGVRISTGNDCIAIKSGKSWVAARLPGPTRGVFISNCLMERGHGAVAIGAEISGGVYEVAIRDCVFRGTDRGLRIKTRRDRGRTAIVDGVQLERINMERVGTPFAVNSFYGCDPDGQAACNGYRPCSPFDDGTPTLRNICLRDVMSENTIHSAGYVLGVPERPVHGLRIERYRVRFDPAATPVVFERAEGMQPALRSGLILSNARGMHLDALDIQGSAGPPLVQENAE